MLASEVMVSFVSELVFAYLDLLLDTHFSNLDGILLQPETRVYLQHTEVALAIYF